MKRSTFLKSLVALGFSAIIGSTGAIAGESPDLAAMDGHLRPGFAHQSPRRSRLLPRRWGRRSSESHRGSGRTP
ncbi:MAG: hypothetical protein ACO30K_14455, partial [bacterium]